MKRSIEFRVWDSQFCKYVCSGDIHICAGSGRAKGKLGGNGYVESFHLEQFTGMSDCDGVDIFGGDICQDHNGIGVVEYVSNKAAFRINYMNGTAKWFIDYNLKGERDSIKVIGKKHQNPELLETK